MNAPRTRTQQDWLNLFNAAIDGTITADALATLEAALLEDDDLRTLFVRYTNLHASTRRYATDTAAKPRGAAHFRGRTPGVSTQEPETFPHYRKGHEPQPFKLRPRHFAVAAAALLIAGLAVGLYFAVAYYQHQVELEKEQAAIAAARDAQPVATLIENTGSPVVYENDIAHEGGEYARGTYSLDSGRAQFLLRSRVTVNLRGKTQLRMYNPASVYLARGQAAFKVPKGAEGFTVHLPDRSKIVDLGTAFKVEVDDEGKTKLRVTEGSVEWFAAGPDAQPILVAAGQIARFVDGHLVEGSLSAVSEVRFGIDFGPTATDEPGNDWNDIAESGTYTSIHDLDGVELDGVSIEVTSGGYNDEGEDDWVGLSTNGGDAPAEFVDTVTTDIAFNPTTVTIRGLDTSLTYDIDAVSHGGGSGLDPREDTITITGDAEYGPSVVKRGDARVNGTFHTFAELRPDANGVIVITASAPSENPVVNGILIRAIAPDDSASPDATSTSNPLDSTQPIETPDSVSVNE